MNHFKLVCKKCKEVIAQCRCIRCDKTIEYGICDKCKNGNVGDEMNALEEAIDGIKDFYKVMEILETTCLGTFLTEKINDLHEKALSEQKKEFKKTLSERTEKIIESVIEWEKWNGCISDEAMVDLIQNIKKV